jgi:hypothetical protein
MKDKIKNFYLKNEPAIVTLSMYALGAVTAIGFVYVIADVMDSRQPIAAMNIKNLKYDENGMLVKLRDGTVVALWEETKEQ